MSQMSDTIELFRRQILSREIQSLRLMTQVFIGGYDRIFAELDPLLQIIQEKISRGEEVSEGYLAKEQRLRMLLGQVVQEMTAFAKFANGHITQEQQTAVEMAQQHSAQLMALSQGTPSKKANIPPSFTRFNPIAVQEAVGRLSEGSPLNDLLKTIAPEAVDSIRKAITTSLIRGENPKQTAQALRDTMNLSLTRSLTIARTEVLSSYRQANLRTYQANEDTLKGWEWSCDFSSRTCAMCLAMSGSFHPLDEPFGSHCNCRCSPIPVSKSWEELGFEGIPDTRPVLESGPEWFAKQSDSVQIDILGKRKYELYKEGKISLQDLVEYRDDPKWGPTRWEKPLKDLDLS